MTMAAAQSFDLVILGSGSTAFAAALAAQELGKTVVMTEERTVGGTCVNRGCLPSKNLIEAAKLLHDARHPRYPGLRAAAMEFDFTALVEQKDDLVHDYRERKYQSLVGGKIRIEKGHAQFVDSHTVEVDGRRLRGDRVLIATGSRPAMPEIDGLDRTPHLTSDLLTSDEKQELRALRNEGDGGGAERGAACTWLRARGRPCRARGPRTRGSARPHRLRGACSARERIRHCRHGRGRRPPPGTRSNGSACRDRAAPEHGPHRNREGRDHAGRASPGEGGRGPAHQRGAHLRRG